MPELPEVETTRRALEPILRGRTIATAKVYDARLRWPVPRDLADRLAGEAVLRLDRRARYLLLRLKDGTLIVHFGMTGTLRALSRPPARGPHDHLELTLDNGVVLRYRDPRRFGAVLWTADPAESHPLLACLGPEPLGPGFSGASLHAAIHPRRIALKLALMDNRNVAGVGNIYASEALFRAGLRPARPCNRVSLAACEKLVGAVREVLEEAIAAGGSTLRDYVDGTGKPGYFQLEHRVYGRRGLPCLACGTPLKELRLGGRSSCYCPRCQT
ncbi:MAG: bifunctional DNA-formamidopyrimidine glycosylase/DNA-(apurinic or apyrimidinic site) lyase [Burkholderiales bacterium]|nr:MAG: bifunctional DNA-formamidopyrimidine glycosylase/DNA-(apurinic or apyrimidinic site) lyase [Burkholderiales bacterium]